MSRPILLTSDEVRQQAIDEGLPPYAVAVIPGMLQPAGTLHTRHSAKSTTLYNSIEVDGAINYLLTSRFTQLIPLMTAPKVTRGYRYDNRYHWSGIDIRAREVVDNLYEKLLELGVELKWEGIGIAEFSTSDKDLTNYMEALDGYLET